MAHSNGWYFACNIGGLGVVFTTMGEILGGIWGVFKRPAKIRAILGTILVNNVWYLSGPLKWVQYW